MLKLEKLPVEYHGEQYELCCNMEALEAFQDEYGGDLNEAMEDTEIHAAGKIFRIMLNLARAERGEEAVTAQQILREYSWAMLRELDVVGMLRRSISPTLAYQHAAAAATGDEDESKN